MKKNEIIEKINKKTIEREPSYWEDLWEELGIKGDTPDEISKRAVCQEAERLVNLFVEERFKTSGRYIVLLFATTKKDGTKVNYEKEDSGAYGLSEDSVGASINTDNEFQRANLLFLKLDRYDNKDKFRPELLFWTLVHELGHIVNDDERKEGKIVNDKFSFHHGVEFWKAFLHSDDSTYKWVRDNIKSEYRGGLMTASLPANFPWKDLDMKETLYSYFPNVGLFETHEALNLEGRNSFDDELEIQKKIPKMRVDEVWKTVSRKIFEWIEQELTKSSWNTENIDELFTKVVVSYGEKNKDYCITFHYHKDGPFKGKFEELIDSLLSNTKKSLANENLNVKTDKIEKIFTEVESLISALFQEATDHTNDWKNNTEHPIRKGVEGRLEDLFTNGEKKLPYNFYELKAMLTGVIDGLPGLVNEEGKMDGESLAFLTDAFTAFKKIKGEGKQVMPTEDGLYKFLKEGDSEKEWLENELKKEKLKTAELLKKVVSLEVAEKERNDQLRQAEEEEQQIMDELKAELDSINHLVTSLDQISAEELTDSLTKLRQMKEKKVDEETYGQLKKSLGQLKLEDRLREQRHRTEQRIADALTDKKGVLGKRIEIKERELPQEKYRNYSETLEQMKKLDEINEFEREILQVIAGQRKEYQTIIEALSWGKKAISDGNVKRAEKARRYLLDYRKLQLRQKEVSGDYSIFLNKSGDFHSLISELEFFIDNSKEITAQVMQNTK